MCLCGGGGGGGVDGSGVVLLVIVVKVLRELCIGAVEVVGVLHIGTVEVDCT